MGSPQAPQFYNDAVERFGNQTDDWATDAKWLAMLTSSHSYVATHTKWGNISANEVTGTGYTKKALASLSVDVATDGVAKFKAANISWTSSTIDARHAAIVKGPVATTATTDLLICSITLDNSVDVSSSNGTFTIQWNADGVFTLT